MQDKRELLDGLGQTPKILSAFVETISEERMRLRRGEGFWTIAEHVAHLAQVQPMLFERLQRFINEEQPHFIPFIPVKDKDAPAVSRPIDVAVALEQFALYRKKQIALLAAADPNTWLKTGTHPEYEAYSLYILIRHILMHDFWHMYRMEELWLAKDSYLTILT